MPIYSYDARDAQGKKFKGKVEAQNERDAANLVRDKQLYITNISEIKTSTFGFSLAFLHRVSFKDLVGFTRQLSTMTAAGLQIPEALTLLKTQASTSGLASIIGNIYRDIQGGGQLSTALAKYPKLFSASYIALVKAGESSGTFDKVMLRLADNLEKDLEFQNKVRGALIYPVIILVAMAVVFAVLMIVVVPKLSEIFVSFGQDLPLTTRVLQSVSNFSVQYWWIILIGLFAFSRIFSKWKATPWGRSMWDAFILKLPLFGGLQKQIILVEFTRTLGLLVGAGVHLLDAMNILVDSLENVHYQNAVKEIAKKVEKGLPLGQLFGQYAIFPPILSQMVKVGEETGKMDESLIKLSTYFESESDQLVKGLTTAIEPLIMIVLGVGVGFIVFSIITPIYQLTSNLK